MQAMQNSDGFLVIVSVEIAVPMWIVYQIGGAHTMQKARAKIMYRPIARLRSAVEILQSLPSRRGYSVVSG